MNGFVFKRPWTEEMLTMMDNFSKLSMVSLNILLMTGLICKMCLFCHVLKGHWLEMIALAHCGLGNFSLSSIF